LSHLISLDIDKAFDSVHWPTLITLIINSNCPPVLTHLIKTFLENRTIIVKWGDKTHNHYLNKGCPQGSVLGPTLWLILAQNILTRFNNNLATIIAFADDFVLLTSGENRRVVERKSQIALDHFVCLAQETHLNISTAKTYHTTIRSRKSILKRFPSIKLSDKFIPHKHQLTFLGVTIQGNLKWHAHINNLKLKLQSQQNSLNRVSGRLWGVSSKLLKAWYLTTSEKTLTYAAAAWARNLTKQEKEQINSCQRPYLLKITRTYRTTPTLALNVLSGIPPLNLTLEYEATRTRILQLNDPPDSLDFFNNKHALIKMPSFHLHPSRKTFYFSEECPAFGSTYKLFTDGSKTDSGVGAAFVVYRDAAIIFSSQTKLNDEASVFQAELLAISQSLLWLSKNYKSLNITEILLLSDSKSSLMAITKFSQQNPDIQKIQILLTTLKHSISIKLHWIKAHTGIQGNEEADKLAKQATTKPNPDSILPLPPSFIKKKLQQLRLTEWSKIWVDSPKGRTTYNYIPNVSTDFLYDSPAFNSLLTDHGPFPQYLHRFKIQGFMSPNCVCGGLGNAQHYMFQCPLTADLHLQKPSSPDHWAIWARKINNNKILKAKTVRIIKFLLDNQDSLIAP
jgi:ribonuclease HI